MAEIKDLESRQDIYDLIDKFEKSNLFELELSAHKGIKIKMTRFFPGFPPGQPFSVTAEDSKGISSVLVPPPPPVPMHQSESAAASEKTAETGGVVIKAPLVGTFYLSASPEAEPYVKIGDKITQGMVICIIEAMKTMNEIESDQDGEIAEILVSNGGAVEYGQPLFRLK
jgi:acetyl-CoA carboxylase biotin carboxyl carrier protein